MTTITFISRFNKLKFITLLTCYAVGVVIFITGFIPKTVTKLPPSDVQSTMKICFDILENNDICSNIYSPTFHTRHYAKFVMIVIDALRADFVPAVSPNGEFNTSLPFTESLIKNQKALSLISKVHSPTVTMPRIKTLTTGGVSTFTDILTNLNAVGLNEDSFLNQARLLNLKSVFYGDETWLKLFPNIFFRSEGTHSFFVSDFKEVDFNVTRHLAVEFSANMDWDVMILHYLGVDHIGHAHGPHSHYLAPKLIEMDDVIKLIYQKLSQTKTESLIFICGDHGMTSAGSHGGVTKGEMLTPFIFINTNKDKGPSDDIKTVDQVDFAATISVLLGLPIPSNNFGNVILDVLRYSGLNSQQILKAVIQNLLQLFEIHQSILPDKKELYLSEIKKYIEKHSKYLSTEDNESSAEVHISLLKFYTVILEDLKNDLISSTSGYNDSYIVLGLIIMWLAFIFLIMTCVIAMQNVNADYTNQFSMKAVAVNKINIITIPVHIAVFMLCSDIIINLILFFGTCLLRLSFNIIYGIRNSSVKFPQVSVMEKVSILLLLSHIASLFSSSYVEEEHQVWYFSICTILVLFCVKSAFSALNYCLKLEYKKDAITPVCSWNIFHLNTNSDQTCLLVLLLLSHRVMRSWNQTGNKWQHLPDTSDWLSKSENFIYTSVLVAVAQVSILLYLKLKMKDFTYQCIGTTLVYFYKCHNELSLTVFKHLNVDPNIIPWIIYGIIIVTLFTRNNLIVNFITSWVLLSQLIGRMHNIPIVAATLFQEYLLHKAVWNIPNQTIFKVLCYLQMAMGSFYYQGNSNSLSTIDVFSGYIGLPSYQPIIAGFLITCNTYSLVILWLILFVYRINCSNNIHGIKSQELFPSFLVMLIYKVFVLAVYCIVMYVMKHHLFIFSVFAPKLFYELCHVSLFTCFTLIALLVTFLKDENT